MPPVGSWARSFVAALQGRYSGHGRRSTGLLRPHPVTVRYKQPFADGSKPIEYGLIAEEVADVYPDLVAHSADGQIETEKYQVLDSMLLNELQEQADQNRQQGEKIRLLKERLAAVDALLPAAPEALTKVAAFNWCGGAARRQRRQRNLT